MAWSGGVGQGPVRFGKVWFFWQEILCSVVWRGGVLHGKVMRGEVRSGWVWFGRVW
jgi:hypothetical protein